MYLCGWSEWDDELRKLCLSRLLPSGWFVVVHDDSGKLVASAEARAIAQRWAICETW